MIGRRSIILGAAAAGACSPLEQISIVEREWQPHFSDLRRGAILVDIDARRLAYWAAENAAYREFPIGVPASPELERRGRTQIVRKRIGPTWAPTPSMIRRNPDLPRFVPAGPDNPMGEYALYLAWQYYAIHGTNDPVTVGRRTTSGCFRLLSGHIEWLFDAASFRTPVVVV